MQNTVWTGLNKTTQDIIVKRLDNGESPYNIAGEYGLYPPSLARKYRKIKQKRERDKPQKVTQQTAIISKPVQQNQKPKITKTTPKIETLYSDGNSLFDIQVLGGANALPEERKAWITTKRPITILFYTDTHFGDEDEQAVDAFLRVAKVVKHDLIVHGGDALECYGLSKYGKDPRKIFTHSFKQEIKRWLYFNDRLREVTDADSIMIFGNHMARYYDWLMQSGNQAMLDLDEMQLDYIMRLSEYGYTPSVDAIYFDGETDFDFPNPFMMGIHGEVSRKDSGNSAKTESSNRGYVNLFQGHVHRLSAAYKRTLQSQIVHIEGGTLRKLSTEWMAYTDHQHGCVKIEYSYADKYVSAYPISILNGKAFIDGVRI